MSTNPFDAAKTIAEALEDVDKDKREQALRWAAESLGLKAPTITPSEGQVQPAAGATPPGSNVAGAIANMKPKEFLRQKKPRTDVERMACLAFYITHARNTQQFTLKDIVTLNTEAASDNFSNPSQAASNAQRQSKFLATAGGKKKQITPHGEDVVNALPNYESVKQIVKERPQRKKRKSVKKAPAKK